RLAVAHIARVEGLAAALGDDLGRPPVAPPDVAEQLLERPLRTGRDRRRRVCATDELTEGLGLIQQRRSEIHVSNLTQFDVEPTWVVETFGPRLAPATAGLRRAAQAVVARLTPCVLRPRQYACHPAFAHRSTSRQLRPSTTTFARTVSASSAGSSSTNSRH